MTPLSPSFIRARTSLPSTCTIKSTCTESWEGGGAVAETLDAVGAMLDLATNWRSGCVFRDVSPHGWEIVARSSAHELPSPGEAPEALHVEHVADRGWVGWRHMLDQVSVQ